MSFILVVDDAESICEIIEIVLSDEGYTVTCAQTGEAGLALVREQRPHLVLLDLTLPDLSGEEFIRAYRRLPSGAAPVIAMSAFSDVAERGARIGADSSLAKPFDLTALRETVQTALSAAEVEGA